LTAKATDDFLLELSDEESDAPKISDDVPAWPDGSGYLRRAFDALVSDRFYGAMGGMSSIFYTAISRYADDHGIRLEPFATFIRAMDGVYIEVSMEKQKQDSPPDPTD
jgi:hypothetical protein